MEYQENNLKSREELEEVRANARDYFRKRDELMEASRSIIFNAKLTER